MTTHSNYHGIALRYRPAVFRSLAGARRWAAMPGPRMRIVLGEVGDFVLVCPSDAARLRAGGYEVIA